MAQKIPLPIRPLRFSGLPADKQQAERIGVASNGQHQPVELSGRFLREQRGERLLRKRGIKRLGELFSVKGTEHQRFGQMRRPAPARRLAHAFFPFHADDRQRIQGQDAAERPDKKRQQFLKGFAVLEKRLGALQKCEYGCTHLFHALYLVVIFSMQRPASLP